MRRVHRNLSREDVEALRLRLNERVPVRGTTIRQAIRTMRMITRKSQTEYARMCGVAPRVLAAIEAGTGSPTVETLEKLLRPFGYRIGVVRVAEDWPAIDEGADATDERGQWSALDKDQEHTRSSLEEARGTKAAESALSRALRRSRKTGG